MNQKTKQIIIIVVVVVVAFFGFKMFFAPSDTADTLVAEKATADNFIDGQVILALLAQLEKVTLDTDIFKNKTFVSLTSFERPLKDQISGRPNPFLPIEAGIPNTVTSRSTSTARIR